jgi:hypothetical protein
MWDRNCPAPAEAPPSIMVVTERPSKAYWGLCTYSGLTITVRSPRADSARGTGHWGWNRFRLTPGVLRMTASAAALLSFQESSGLLHELAEVEVSAKQVERAAEALGAEISRTRTASSITGQTLPR